MMRGIRWVTIATLWINGLFLVAEEGPTILAFGDSITEGGKTFVSYREVLIPKMKEMNLSFKFIGPKKDGASSHSGYGGKSTNSLLKVSKKIYKAHPADIVLIHSGHNSFSDQKPIPGIIKDTETILQNFREINPKVTVLLAQVIHAGKLPKYSYIPELNKELASLVERLLTKGFQVKLVNQANGFDWKTDTISDKVHPNLKGATKMADKWLAAMMPMLNRKMK
jgi:lysophospholipase L1-like esterase